VGIKDRLRRLERRLQPEPDPPQLVSEDTRRTLDAIAAARHDGTIRDGEPLDVEALTSYLIGRGVSPETASGYVAYFARRWPGGTDLHGDRGGVQAVRPQERHRDLGREN
jgi:hypothetical protein